MSGFGFGLIRHWFQCVMAAIFLLCQHGNQGMVTIPSNSIMESMWSLTEKVKQLVWSASTANSYYSYQSDELFTQSIPTTTANSKVCLLAGK